MTWRLTVQGQPFVYEGDHARNISFPIGGIGSGCLGLAGHGQLIDWEIFNRPDKGGLNGFSHFAIKARRDGRTIDARVVQGDLPGPYFSGAGFGPPRETMAGLPHFRHVRFEGAYPIATLDFAEPRFPGTVRLMAFNPLIPLDDADSSIPAALFEFAITNTSDATVDYTLAFTVRNPDGQRSINRTVQADDMTLMRLRDGSHEPDDPAFGELCFGTDARRVQVQRCWFRGRWFDDLGVWWRDFTADKPLPERSYDEDQPCGHDHASLAASVSVPAGHSGVIRYVLTWHYPNMCNYWDAQPSSDNASGQEQKPRTWKNYYATRFPDAPSSAAYVLEQWDRLSAQTRRFQKSLFSSTVPAEVLDAVSANISILKSPTVLRLDEGSFYGFEGCHAKAGCCEGSCQHVWNYAYALPMLFPRLERSVRELEYRYSLTDEGEMRFRFGLPIGESKANPVPCADGQFGVVIQMYREWKICGDTQWLAQWWPRVKKTIEFAWSPNNRGKWDPQRTGVLWGRQHHTLDMELFGPNSWLTGLYLGALKAGARMAAAVGDTDAAEQYQALFAKGKAWVDEHLFNGEYYHQQVDLDDRSLLEPFSEKDLQGNYPPSEPYHVYWSEEHGELKYQIGQGCGIDQVLGQWHANLVGLGEIFDPAQTRSSLRAIYEHNHKPSMRDFANFCRLYCLNDEAGTIMFDWPQGQRKPVMPAVYAEETMHGFEYQAACHMIQEGMVEEGLTLVRAVRDRYDGRTRNPWNEIECGSNYARSMASYALLLTFSGFSCDMTRGLIGFDPIFRGAELFGSFWSVATAWGDFLAKRDEMSLTVHYGKAAIKVLRLPFLDGAGPWRVTIGSTTVEHTREADCFMLNFVLNGEPSIAAGQTLRVARA